MRLFRTITEFRSPAHLHVHLRLIVDGPRFKAACTDNKKIKASKLPIRCFSIRIELCRGIARSGLDNYAGDGGYKRTVRSGLLVCGDS